jgi:hypothetical protein
MMNTTAERLASHHDADLIDALRTLGTFMAENPDLMAVAS